MIYVTGGHEKGIGLEVFFKSVLLFNQEEINEFRLISNKKETERTLKKIGINYKFINDKIILGKFHIPFCPVEKSKNYSHSLTAILEALSLIRNGDVLLTLPTTKTELKYKSKNHLGHTEFFRSYYKNDSLSMNFIAPSLLTCLLTDHIPLKEVPKVITPAMVTSRVSSSILGFEKYFGKIKEVYFAGINPHAGESGVLGSEDKNITKAITTLKKKFKTIKFIGPLSGDTLHTKFGNNNHQRLFVYAHHDQGLALFKHKNHTLGSNITFGLPFIRLSVDHGTAFDLYGKNKADYTGMFYNMKLALAANK